MKSLTETFWQLCLFRIGPQDLPSSYQLMWIMLIIYAIASAGIGVISLAPEAALMSGVVDSVLVMLFSKLILMVRGTPERLVQTVTALAGAGVLVSLLALPWLFVQQQAGPDNPMFLPSFALLTLMCWNLAIAGHILRHALSIPFFGGFIVALVYTILSINVLRALFVPAA